MATDGRPFRSRKRLLSPAVCAIVALVVADQAVKLALVRPLLGISFPFVEGVLAFYPKVNENLTWGGNFIEPLSLPAVAIALNVLVIGLYASGYAFYWANVRSARSVPAAVFCLGMAGSVCGLLDRTLWGGSLDFLQVAGWFVFDVKDCYLVASLGMFVVLALRHQDEFSVSAYARFSKDGALRVANRLRSAIRKGGSTGSS